MTRRCLNRISCPRRRRHPRPRVSRCQRGGRLAVPGVRVPRAAADRRSPGAAGVWRRGGDRRPGRGRDGLGACPGRGRRCAPRPRACGRRGPWRRSRATFSDRSASGSTRATDARAGTNVRGRSRSPWRTSTRRPGARQVRPGPMTQAERSGERRPGAALADAGHRGHPESMSKIWFGLHLPNYTFPDRSPAQVFDATVEQAKAAEAAGFSLVTVMDHLNQIPGIGQQDEPMLEGWSVLAALARETKTRPPRHARDRRDLPQPGAAREDRHDARRDLGRARDLRARRRVVRGRARRLRVRVPADPRAHGPPRRGADDREGHVHAGAVDVRGPVLPGHGRHQRPAAGPGRGAEDPRRRGRGAADAQDRREARRHDALVPARPRDAPAQEGRPRPGTARPSGATRRRSS